MAKPIPTTTKENETPESAAAVLNQRIIEKMQAGLTREQAEEILAAQAKHDAAQEA
jgi:hypothetical protein